MNRFIGSVHSEQLSHSEVFDFAQKLLGRTAWLVGNHPNFCSFFQVSVMSLVDWKELQGSSRLRNLPVGLTPLAADKWLEDEKMMHKQMLELFTEDYVKARRKVEHFRAVLNPAPGADEDEELFLWGSLHIQHSLQVSERELKSTNETREYHCERYVAFSNLQKALRHHFRRDYSFD
jgi:hypothetical protein